MPRRPTVPALKASIQRLSLEDRQALLDWLSEHVEAERNAALVLEKGSAAVVDRRQYEGKAYHLEKRRCGRQDCTCAEGELAEVGHGPYWYAYWRDQGKVKSLYVGKRPPWEEERTS
ncbi:MAG: hypothetical protein KME13_25615 [Myxacorys californica WJT36-NPBG1]|nr:hypothetical protein [Myxacorys californica WJT36-NPBG1]